MREPGKLRAWLCGIARNRISNCLRREGRRPLHAAESLEAVAESPSAEPLPSDQAISKEEAAILWHSIEHVPDLYREPLVLFYREGESVERVAGSLELSEDAVRQRLSRGRKLLHEQVLALVEGTLRQTAPGKTFTLGVMAALPLLTTTTKAASASAVAKGSSAAKTVFPMAAVGTILLFYSLVAFLAFLGGWAGYAMSRACVSSFRQCENIIRFWRPVAVGFAVCLSLWLFFPALVAFIRLLLLSLDWVRFFTPLYEYIQPLLPLDWMRSFPLSLCFGGPKFWTDLFCSLVAAALAIWVRRWWRCLPNHDMVTRAPARLPRRRFIVWLSLGMIGPAWLAGLFVLSTLSETAGPIAEKRLTLEEVQRIVTERKDAHFAVWRGWDGTKNLHVALPESGRFTIRAVADEAMLKVLDENRVDYNSILVDMQEPWPFGRLLTVFVASMGGAILVRLAGKRQWGTSAPETAKTLEPQNSQYGRLVLEIHTDPMTRRIFGIAFAVVFLLVFGANAFAAKGLYVVLFVGLVKSAFLGLIAAVGVLCLRAQRKAS